MTDNIKDMILNPEENPPERAEMDFSGMSDEEFMKLNTEDIFFEDMDRFLAEKERRLSKSSDVEDRISEEAASATADSLTENPESPENAAVFPGEPVTSSETSSEAEPVKAITSEAEASEGTAEEAGQPESSSAEQVPSAEGHDQVEQPEGNSGETTTAGGSSVETVQAEESTGEAASSEETPAEAASSEEIQAAVPAEVSPAAGPSDQTVQGAPAYVAPPVTPSEPVQEKKKPGIGALIVVGSLLCCAIIAIAAAYFYYADYFTKRFFPGTIINDRDVSVLEPVQVKQDIANEIVTYRLDIKELNDVTETITAEDIALAYVDDGAVDKILSEQDTKFWFLKLLGTKSYEVSTGTTYDKEKAEQVVNGLSCLQPANITEPQDAALVDNGTSFSIQPEVEGNKLDEEKFRTMVFDALDTGVTEIDVVTDDCYLHPSVRSDNENLNTRMNEYNAILSVNVYYTFGENTEYVNGDALRPYITDDGNHVTLSDDYARKLVYGWGQKYDTFGLAREFTTHSGQVVTIPEGGDYGWVINKDVTIADVQDAVANQAQGERTPTFLYSAMGWDNGDITGTYVEVSISEQKLWCYHNYELVMETDVVTGLPTSERETRRGIFAIDAKKEDATLGRLDVQGYSSPVSYWAPFDGGRGLHDAPWRGSFGGDIYLSDGSHGCVNIPEQNMEAIYNAIEIGNAVIVY